MIVPLATATVIGWTGDRFLLLIAGLDDTAAAGGTGLGMGVVVEAPEVAAVPEEFELEDTAPEDDWPADDDAIAGPLPTGPGPAPTVIGPPVAAVVPPVVAVVATAGLFTLWGPELAPCCPEFVDGEVHPPNNAVAATRVRSGAKPRVMRIVTSSRVSVPRG
ncbi:MAG: hypothetical protein M3Z00_04010 [Actinomycetota bacterium]|nr:hypothetical protein [Actinomycetota bacterium]